MIDTAPSPVAAVRKRVAAGLAERLPEHLERLGWNPDRLADHQRRRLRRLLAHAIERSPFHAERLRGIDPDRFELADLDCLPVMSKAEMMDSFDAVVTDRRLERGAVEAHLAASTDEPKLLLDEYVCLTSGGSSGVRGVFVQTVGEYTDTAASIVRPGIARLTAAGGFPPGGAVIGMVAAASPVHATGFAAAAATAAPVRVLSAPATLPIAQLVERLNRLQPPTLMGYPSVIVQLAREQRAGRLRIAPRSISTTSETLTPEQRAAIGGAFGAPVIDQFASTEGLVGHSAPNDRVLTFASDMCIAELVGADNRPVADGEPSAKVLITNLHNLTQPLIRYELTDRFVRHPGRGALRATVEGRADEHFHYGAVQVHPQVFRTELVRRSAVREYQVLQTERGADVALVVDGQLDDRALSSSLEDGLRAAGVSGARVAVHRVAAIPRARQTGKSRRFVPLGTS